MLVLPKPETDIDKFLRASVPVVCITVTLTRVWVGVYLTSLIVIDVDPHSAAFWPLVPTVDVVVEVKVDSQTDRAPPTAIVKAIRRTVAIIGLTPFNFVIDILIRNCESVI